MSRDPVTAAVRFGLGARPGEIAAATPDPRAWLARQLAPAPQPMAFVGLASGARRADEFLRRRQNAHEAERLLRQKHWDAYFQEAALRVRVQVESDRPFHERLVAFWANHFTVSVQRPPVLALVAPFEREAIRPHVTGRFADMLLAAVRHPAMLLYLDQAASIGPRSRLGSRRQRGLNENLAREILELHTLGVDGGYAQGDVTELARILTGWSLARPDDPAPAGFHFRGAAHEPGPKILLGRRFAESGEREGVEALALLATHPATARHLATKLVRHFVADDPPAPAVDRVAWAFAASDGDLDQVTRTLIDLPEAWRDAGAKVKSPHEFLVSALRATGVDATPRLTLGGLRALGQPSAAAPSPQGWPDTAAQWIGPESLMRRAEWAMALAGRIEDPDPRAIATNALGDATRAETIQGMARAASSAEAVALFLASPEFQRR